MVVIRWETRSRRSYVWLDHPPLQGNNARIDKNMSESRRDKWHKIYRKLSKVTVSWQKMSKLRVIYPK